MITTLILYKSEVRVWSMTKIKNILKYCVQIQKYINNSSIFITIYFYCLKTGRLITVRQLLSIIVLLKIFVPNACLCFIWYKNSKIDSLYLIMPVTGVYSCLNWKLKFVRAEWGLWDLLIKIQVLSTFNTLSYLTIVCSTLARD